jgi:lysophospholipase L1-like esterase
VRSRVALVAGAVMVCTWLLSPAPALADDAPPPTTPTQPAAPVRVMVNGDSISQGFDGDLTWRYRLWQELRRQHVSVDMVGPFDQPHLTAGWHTTSYGQSGWDRDHDSVGGSELSSLAATIASQVRRERPDVIVLEAGLNDLRHGASPATVLRSLDRYVSQVRAVEPQVRIIVSPVLASLEKGMPGLASRISSYDALLGHEVATLSSTGSPVTLAATTSGWSASRMTWDGTHPDPAGECFLAQRYAQALLSAHAVPGLGWPQIRTVTTWDRQPPVHVTLRGGRALISWDTERSTGARVWIKRAGHAAQVIRTKRATPGLHVRSRRLVAGATYVVRVSIQRRAMVTPFGPATLVQVPRRHG